LGKPYAGDGKIEVFYLGVCVLNFGFC